jgi:hypothetical protein
MRTAVLLSLLVVAPTASLISSDTPQAADEKGKKPQLSLRASPPIAFSPANIHLVAELKGGPDDFEEYYCRAVEWDWGDGTRSENSSDCDPFEAGVSQITRRFSKTHVYNIQGRYRIQVRLKRNTKLLTTASTNIQVRPGIRDMGGPYEDNPRP